VVAQVVVDAAVAFQPAREFRVCVGFADRVDLSHIRRVAGEFEVHAVGRRRVDRLAIAMVDFAKRFAGGVEAGL